MRQSRQEGHGLVEYALILALVALVAIVVVALTGVAAQRGYGVLGGALGARYDTQGQRVVEITGAQCIALQSANLTGLWVIGNTNYDVAHLTGSTERAIGTGLEGLPAPIEANGPSGFKFHPLLAYKADLGVCPKSVVIQAADGAVAVAPVSAEMQP